MFCQVYAIIQNMAKRSHSFAFATQQYEVRDFDNAVNSLQIT